MADLFYIVPFLPVRIIPQMLRVLRLKNSDVRFERLLFAFIILFLPGWLSAAVVTTNFPIQIVNCRENVDVPGLIAEYHLTPKYIYQYALNGFAAPMNSAILYQLQEDPRVLTAEADAPVFLATQTVPADVTRIGADMFPVGRSNKSYLPLNVDVAILDSGIDSHPDLPPSYQTYFAFSTDGSDALTGTSDHPNGHGTSVAGVVAAQDNDFGIVGVAPGVRIWDVKCTGPAPYNTWTDVIKGMDFVTANSNQIAVANISISSQGGGAPVGALRSAVHRKVHGGTVVVVSAGNQSEDMAGADGIFGTSDDPVPASLAESMAVSAMDPANDTFATFSNFGQLPRTNAINSDMAANMVVSTGGTIDVAAPGVNILITGSTNIYLVGSGTSFSSPCVAGLVALYIAVNGRATNEFGVYKIRQAIVDNSLPQSQWRTNQTHDPDTNPEPLAMASLNWVPKTLPIASEPISQIVPTGNAVTFSVGTCVGHFTYQWLFNGTNLSDSFHLTGSTNGTLMLTNVDRSDAGNYQVMVSSDSGSNTLSSTAVLTVLPSNLIQNGSFEWPPISQPHAPQTYNSGDAIAGWTVESATSQFLVYSNSMTGSANASMEYNWHPTPADGQFAQLSDSTLGTTVLRQDIATALESGSNYYLGFLQSGFVDFRAPAQVTVSLAPTGSTNEVWTQTFSVRAQADWTRQQTYLSVATNGFYTLRLRSSPGFEALVDDVVLAPAPPVSTPTTPAFQTVTQFENALILTWTGNNRLQTTTNPGLGFGDLPTATSPYTNSTLNDPQRFFRLRSD